MAQARSVYHRIGPLPYHAHGNNGKKIAIARNGKGCKYLLLVIENSKIFIMELNNRGIH